MPTMIHPVTLANLTADSPALLSAQLASFGNSSAIVNMFYPVAKWPAHHDSILEHGAARIRSEQSNPSLHWMKIDASDAPGVIAAAIQWKFFATNPYAASSASPPVVPFWLPDDPVAPKVRELADRAMKTYVEPKARMRGRPHAWINNMFTRPEYQGRGMAGDLIEWGVRKADEMGLEAHVEASTLGRPVYARYGFVQVATHDVDVDTEGDEELTRLRKEFNFPQVIYLMWRPVGGRYVPGETPVPWKGGLKPNEDWRALFEE